MHNAIETNGLVFTPYLVDERAPYADAFIRGSFIGSDSSHKRADFIRSILEELSLVSKILCRFINIISITLTPLFLSAVGLKALFGCKFRRIFLTKRWSA